MIIQSLNTAISLLQRIDEAKKGSLDEGFITKVQDELSKDDTVGSLVSAEAANKSITLNNYFLNQKKFLSGYSNEENTKVPSNLNNSLVKKILHSAGPNVKCQDVARCSRFSADVIQAHMTELANQKFGNVNHEKPLSGGRVTVIFAKKDISEAEMEVALEFSEKLNSVGIKIEEYKNQFENNENVLCPSKKQRIA